MRRAWSSSVFAVHKSRILLIRHKALGKWLPVGGELESKWSEPDRLMLPESPLECARRELLEETGLVGRFPKLHDNFDGSPLGFLGYEEHLAGSKGLHMNFCFVALVDSDEIKSDGSFTAHAWYTPGEVEYVVGAPLNVKQIALKLARYTSFIFTPES